MTTNEERCEVAKNLREIKPSKKGHIEWWRIAQALGLVEIDHCFGWEKFKRESVNRLADLIEPGKERECKAEIYTATVPKFDHDEEVDMYECSLCGFYLSHVKDEYIPNYCPHCGAKVVE